MKIRPVGAQSFHADKQTNRKTDMTKLVIAFRNFATAPIKAVVLHASCGMQREREEMK